MEIIPNQPKTLRSLGEQYRKQAEVLGEQIARRRKAFETNRSHMTLAQMDAYYAELEVLKKQRHDAEVTSGVLVYYYEHGSLDPDAPLTFAIDVTPLPRRKNAEGDDVEKAG